MVNGTTLKVKYLVFIRKKMKNVEKNLQKLNLLVFCI